jgi:hypothetical protein
MMGVMIPQTTPPRFVDPSQPLNATQIEKVLRAEAARVTLRDAILRSFDLPVRAAR